MGIWGKLWVDQKEINTWENSAKTAESKMFGTLPS